MSLQELVRRLSGSLQQSAPFRRKASTQGGMHSFSHLTDRCEPPLFLPSILSFASDFSPEIPVIPEILRKSYEKNASERLHHRLWRSHQIPLQIAVFPLYIDLA